MLAVPGPPRKGVRSRSNRPARESDVSLASRCSGFTVQGQVMRVSDPCLWSISVSWKRRSMVKPVRPPQQAALWDHLNERAEQSD
jgi:hypothetical protein